MNRNAAFLVCLVAALAGLLLMEWGWEADRAVIGPWSGGQAEAGGMPETEDTGRQAQRKTRGPTGGRALERTLDAGVVGEISGQVMDELWNPVSGARVSLREIPDRRAQGLDGSIAAEAVSDGRGGFRLRKLRMGYYRLRVLARGHEVKSKAVWLRANAPTRLNLTLRLREGFRLEGLVVDDEGRPLPHAWVMVGWLGWHSIWGGSPDRRELRSDAAGRFSLRHLPRGKVHVLAWAPGRALGMVRWVAGSAVRAVVRLPRRSPYKISFGFIESKSEEAQDPGASPGEVSLRIAWHTDRVSLPLPPQLSARQVPSTGQFGIEGLCEGQFEIRAASEVIALEKPLLYRRVSREAPEAWVELAWASKVGIRGRLLLADGNPAEGIVLSVWQKSVEEALNVTSDAEGRFEFPPCFHRAQRPSVSIKASGLMFCEKNSNSNQTEMIPGDTENVWTLKRAARYTGRVLDVRGQPVAGATVWLHKPDRPNYTYAHAIADAKGEFRFSQPTEYWEELVLDARTETLVCISPLLLKFKDPQTGEWLPALDNLVLRLTEGASIEGQVVDEKGMALPGVGVHIEDDFVLLSRSQGSAVPGPRQQFRPVLSNREGRFRFVGLMPGLWWPSVRGERQIDNPAFSTIRVEDGEHKTGLRLLFQKR